MMKLQEVINKYREDLESKTDWKEGTLRNYISRAECFFAYCFGLSLKDAESKGEYLKEKEKVLKTKDYDKIRSLDPNTFQKKINNFTTSYSSSSMGNYLSALTDLYERLDIIGIEKTASKVGLIEKVKDTVDLKHQNINWIRRVDKIMLFRDEIMNVIDYASPLKVKAGLMLGYDVALRTSELLELDVGDVDLETNTISFIPKKKSGKSENMVEPELWIDRSKSMLRKYLDHYKNLINADNLRIMRKRPLFYGSRRGTTMSGSYLIKHMREAIREAIHTNDIPKIDPKEMRYHDFARHIRATNLLRDLDNRLIDVRNRLRHKQMSTTLHYTHLLSAKKKERRARKDKIKVSKEGEIVEA